MKLSVNTKISSALNPAFLNQIVEEKELNKFIESFNELYSALNAKESEENQKNIITFFLKKAFYDPNFAVNTKERIDLAIFNGKSAINDKVAVIFEAKRPKNKSEMVTPEKPNVRAFQEILLYYLRETVHHKNLEVKTLIVTNINDWYIIDARDFESLISDELKDTYSKFRDGDLIIENNPNFYNKIAKPFFDASKDLPCLKISLDDINKLILSADEDSIEELTNYYKLISPQNLLRLKFANDTNKLNTEFYNELLHIIGLEETTPEGTKKVITRIAVGKRNEGSLIENTITILKNRNKLKNIENLELFGETEEQQLFSVALELCITWLNRILFLKLLEGQLIKYNKGSGISFAFLNSEKVKDFDELDELFFEVLAIRTIDRPSEITSKFGHIPYLNSSLFEPTELEQKVLEVNGIKDRYVLPLYSHTVLKEGIKRKEGSMLTLQYLFAFLDSYDFAADNKKKVQKERKTIINASVLGLIFEKINGYKEGSYFTPGFVTEYMCREVIRKTVIQKFNEILSFDCKEWHHLQRKVLTIDIKTANEVVNKIKICDPAVGSGHFLVSALNEIIAIKQDLQILANSKFKPFRGLNVVVENDELLTTLDGELFNYNFKDEKSQEIQETLFNEKRTIIENCLFGVDINSKSVMICQLRLWIELLKNAYYLPDPKTRKIANTELQTLPNIDINIKVGNSLISRFALNSDLKAALSKSIKYNFKYYKECVNQYKETDSKETKQAVSKIIDDIKSNFFQKLSSTGPLQRKIDKASYELSLLIKPDMFREEEESYGHQDLKKERDKKISDLSTELAKLEEQKRETESIYKNAFEWRFEFPEILSNESDFIGFDAIIGNPPYVTKLKQFEIGFYQKNYLTIQGKKYDLFRFFYEKTLSLLKDNGIHNFIVPDVILHLPQASILRKYILENFSIYRINNISKNPFDEAQLEAVITFIQKNRETNEVDYFDILEPKNIKYFNSTTWHKGNFDFNINQKDSDDAIMDILRSKDLKIEDVSTWKKGLGVYSRQHLLLKFTAEEVEDILTNKPWTLTYKKDDTYGPELEGKDVGRYTVKWNEKKWLSYGPWLAFQRPLEYFSGPRLLVREITTGGKYRVFSSYIEDTYYNNQSMFNGVLKKGNDYELKFLLALINSSLFSYWQKVTSPKSNRKLFPTLLMETIEYFPFPSTDKKGRQPFINLVEKIMDAKKSDPKSDTSSIEKEIDKMIFSLYNISNENQLLIEDALK